MKEPKDRLHRVLIVGATPSGILAANKLGELGIPVTLVDPDPDLDEKLSREEWRLASGVAMNYAHRSGLLRIMRNPLIHRIMPGSVTSLRHTPQGFRARISQQQTFVDRPVANWIQHRREIHVADGDCDGLRITPGRDVPVIRHLWRSPR